MHRQPGWPLSAPNMQLYSSGVGRLGSNGGELLVHRAFRRYFMSLEIDAAIILRAKIIHLDAFLSFRGANHGIALFAHEFLHGFHVLDVIAVMPHPLALGIQESLGDAVSGNGLEDLDRDCAKLTP